MIRGTPAATARIPMTSSASISSLTASPPVQRVGPAPTVAASAGTAVPGRSSAFEDAERKPVRRFDADVDSGVVGLDRERGRRWAGRGSR